jgi:hypothetical protein
MADFSVLGPIAQTLLDKAGGDIARALPHYRRLLFKRVDLLDVLALAHLEALAEPYPVPGPAIGDAHSDPAGKTAAGQRASDAHPERAGGGPTSKPAAVKPIKVHEHRRARARTNEDRKIAILAMTKNLEGVLQRPILGRAIGDYSWRELPDARRTLTQQMAEHLWLGARSAEDAILIDKLLCHAAVDDLNAKVSEVVSAATLARLEIEASQEFAPKLDVTKGAAHGAFVKQLEYHSS